MDSLPLDDLLDFPTDDAVGDDSKPPIAPSGVLVGPDDPNRPLPETEEEELEWLSNKDAFPPVEMCVDIDLLTMRAGGIGIDKHQSPVSVLDNSTTTTTPATTDLMSSCGTLKPPHRARSKGRRRRDSSSFPCLQGEQFVWNQGNDYNNKEDKKEVGGTTTEIGRKCQHCGVDKTPLWRAGPLGPKTLCNACGVRYKSGRLVPEYRPANSPTFSSRLHSNSHRKIVEMRKQKHGMGMLVKPEDKGFPGISKEQTFSDQDHEYDKDDMKKAESTMIGRKCQHCGTEKTPKWWAGPLGMKLCNACWKRYKYETGRKCQHCGTKSSLVWWEDGPPVKSTLCDACYVRYGSKLIGRTCHRCGDENTANQWEDGPPGEKPLCNACYVRCKSEMIRRKCQHCGDENTTKRWEDGPPGKKTMCSACYARYKYELIRRKCQHCGTETTSKWWEDGPSGKKTMCNACHVRYKVEVMERKCLHCGAENTPQWRAGPLGARTLCNACGVKYGRRKLIPEYRLASSTTFSSKLHLNMIRKVTGMRSQKHELGIGGEGEMIGRKCQHCRTETASQWWDSSLGTKTLWDPSGKGYKKSRNLDMNRRYSA